MAFDQHKNFAYSTVATAPSPATSGTSLVVASGDGTKFPTPPFNATVWPIATQPTTANAEIVRVTAVSTDTLTITRAQESTSARTVVIGDQIAAGITVKSLTDVEAVGQLGYAQKTANSTTTNTTATSISLGVTVTVPASSRGVKITGFGRALYHSSANVAAHLTIWDGTVGSGTQLSDDIGFQAGSSGTTPGIVMAVVTPAAGSKTYNIGLHADSAGTATFEAAATYPAFILVENI